MNISIKTKITKIEEKQTKVNDTPICISEGKGKGKM